MAVAVVAVGTGVLTSRPADPVQRPVTEPKSRVVAHKAVAAAGAMPRGGYAPRAFNGLRRSDSVVTAEPVDDGIGLHFKHSSHHCADSVLHVGKYHDNEP